MARIARIAGKVLLGLLALMIAAIGWAFVTSQQRYQKHWTAHDASFPIPFPVAGADSGAALAQAVARGQHLMDSQASCTECHAADLGGGIVIGKDAVERTLVGYWAAPNLTLGEGSVTRGFSAHDWDLAVRHGIRHDGQTSSMPSDAFLNLSDHELSDLVAYIRSRPPVNRDLGSPRFGLIFSIVTATDPKTLPAFVIDHQKPHAVEPPPQVADAQLGAHIAQICSSCHGPNYSGGKIAGDPNMPIVANLTPDATGIKGWSERDFLRAMHEGTRPDGTKLKDAMPWRVYGKMSDVELAAVWAFLSTLPPVPKGKR